VNLEATTASATTTTTTTTTSSSKTRRCNTQMQTPAIFSCWRSSIMRIAQLVKHAHNHPFIGRPAMVMIRGGAAPPWFIIPTTT
jgi:hypothetical protein